MNKNTFTPGVWLDGAIVPNIRSSISPSVPALSYVWYRNGKGEDPVVSLTSSNFDALHAQGSHSSYNDMRQ